MNKKLILLPALLSALSMCCFGCNSKGAVYNENPSSNPTNTANKNEELDPLPGYTGPFYSCGLGIYKITSEDGKESYTPTITKEFPYVNEPVWDSLITLSKEKTYTVEISFFNNGRYPNDTQLLGLFSIVYQKEFLDIKMTSPADVPLEKAIFTLTPLETELESFYTTIVFTGENRIENENIVPGSEDYGRIMHAHLSLLFK